MTTCRVWRGELRSAAGAPLLTGVISNRVDVRAAAAAAERAVERRAEPLLALFRPAKEWEAAGGLLAVAWDRLIANSAHDSACACCTDAVADQVLARYAEARQVADALAEQALADLAAETGTGRGEVLVVNIRPGVRAGVVEVTAPAGAEPQEGFVGLDGIPRTVQLLGVSRTEVFAARVAGAKVGWVADRIEGCMFDGHPVRRWSVNLEPERLLQFEAAGPGEAAVELAEARDTLRGFGRDSHPVAVRMQGPAQRRILVETGPVVGYGWTTLRPGQPTDRDPDRPRFPFRCQPPRWTTGSSGWSSTRMTAASPSVPREDSVSAGSTGTSTAATAATRTRGAPLPSTRSSTGPRPCRSRSKRRVRCGGGWRSAPGTSGRPTLTGTSMHARPARHPPTPVTVVTNVSVTAGDPVVAVETALENRCRDHRLRVHFPLPAPVTGSDAGCAFAVVRRGLEAESGPAESPPPDLSRPPLRGLLGRRGRSGLHRRRRLRVRGDRPRTRTGRHAAAGDRLAVTAAAPGPP